MPRQLKTFCVIFSVVGAMLLCIAGYATSRVLQLERIGQTASGHVVRFERDHDGSYFPVVEFRVNGDRMVTFRSRSGSRPPAFREGEEVTVLFDPDDPQHATIQSFGQMWTGPLIAGSMGLAFSGVPAGIVFAVGRRRRKIEWLRQNGQRVSTRFGAVEINTRIRVNRRSPFRIISEGQNPFTNELQSFRSDNLWSDPAPFLGNREVLDVLIDPNQPKRYWMDTSFLPRDGD